MIYVGHLPKGLFEPQLKAYFEQFGRVLRLRLSRSKKVTAQSWGPGLDKVLVISLFWAWTVAQDENGLRWYSGLRSDNWAHRIPGMFSLLLAHLHSDKTNVPTDVNNENINTSQSNKVRCHWPSTLTSLTCRLVVVKATLLSSMTVRRWQKSWQRRWTTTWWESGSSNVSICDVRSRRNSVVPSVVYFIRQIFA